MLGWFDRQPDDNPYKNDKNGQGILPIINGLADTVPCSHGLMDCTVISGPVRPTHHFSPCIHGVQLGQGDRYHYHYFNLINNTFFSPLDLVRGHYYHDESSLTFSWRVSKSCLSLLQLVFHNRFLRRRHSWTG